jgi:uncharacterized DUF497 family protein
MYIHAHIACVHVTWDPRKSARNATDRGFDFAFAALIFTGPTVERTDTRRDYGEVRRLAVGRAASAVLTVVYTDRVAADGTIERRIISARVSTRRERQVYQAAYPEV